MRLLGSLALSLVACAPMPARVDGGSGGSSVGGGSVGGGVSAGGSVAGGAAAGGSTAGGSTGGGSALPDAGAGHVALGLPIPAPGTMMNQWGPAGSGNVPAGHGTPQTAWQVGIATQALYLGATLDPVTGNTFWVFQSGPAFTSFEVYLTPVTGAPEWIHVHDGAGGVLGALLTPTQYDVMNGTGQARWTLSANHVYVVEVHGPGGIQF